MLITVESVHMVVRYYTVRLLVCMHACVFVLQISGYVWQFIYRSFDLVLVADLNTEFLIEREQSRQVSVVFLFL